MRCIQIVGITDIHRVCKLMTNKFCNIERIMQQSTSANNKFQYHIHASDITAEISDKKGCNVSVMFINNPGTVSSLENVMHIKKISPVLASTFPTKVITTD